MTFSCSSVGLQFYRPEVMSVRSSVGSGLRWFALGRLGGGDGGSEKSKGVLSKAKNRNFGGRNFLCGARFAQKKLGILSRKVVVRNSQFRAFPNKVPPHLHPPTERKSCSIWPVGDKMFEQNAFQEKMGTENTSNEPMATGECCVF